MNKQQYLEVIERVIKSQRSDVQKIDRLQESFKLYNQEIINEMECLAEDFKNEENSGFIHMCIDIVEAEYE